MDARNELAQFDPKDIEEMRELVLAREKLLHQQGFEQGLREARQEARQKARQEGLREGLQKAILRLIARRWPELGPSAASWVPDSAGEAALEELLDRLDEVRDPRAARSLLEEWGRSISAS